jgi:hypothetical protein
MRLPAGGRRLAGPAGPDQQVSLRLPATGMHHPQSFGIRGGLAGRASERAVGGQQLIDLAGDLDPAMTDHDQVVGHPLQLGQRVRGEHDRHRLVGHRGHHAGHEVVPGQRVEHGQRLIQHQQLRVPGHRQGERQLGLLAAGQLADLPVQPDAELSQPGPGERQVPVPVEAAGNLQHVGDGQVAVQRGVLRDETDAVQGCG